MTKGRYEAIMDGAYWLERIKKREASNLEASLDDWEDVEKVLVENDDISPNFKRDVWNACNRLQSIRNV